MLLGKELRRIAEVFFCLSFLDALASFGSMLESDSVSHSLMFLRFCQILGISSGYVQSMFRVCSEYVQGMESDSLSHVFEILSNLGHIIRLSSGYVQGMFRVCSGYV